MCTPATAGTTALIWNGVANSTSMATPSSSTVVALPAPERPLPKIDTAPPGARPLPRAVPFRH